MIERVPQGRSARPAWQADLQRRAMLPPRIERDALTAEPAGAVIGSIEPATAHRLVQDGLPLRRTGTGWCVAAPTNESLAAIAHGLDRAGLGGRWRGELLDVVAAGHGHVGVIERAAVRPLGIATQAVHLVCTRSDDSVWVQQRAFDKATDPGQWDTTMGGQVGAGESIAETLARETWEEAGLRSTDLRNVRGVDPIDTRRPVQEGYLVERIHVFEAEVADDVVPRNQDGEVHAFECLATRELIARVEAGLFTLEAALILAAWFERRGLLG